MHFQFQENTEASLYGDLKMIFTYVKVYALADIQVATS